MQGHHFDFRIFFFTLIREKSEGQRIPQAISGEFERSGEYIVSW